SVAARYRSILDESVSAGGAEALLEGIPEDLSKKELAAALKLVVDRQIRYTGIEFGDASYIPRSPAETMQRRFGDCKDTAALMVSLLRARGVDATIALLDSGNGRDIDAEVPGFRFDHAIV